MDKDLNDIKILIILIKRSNTSGEIQQFLYDLVTNYTYTQQLSMSDKKCNKEKKLPQQNYFFHYDTITELYVVHTYVVGKDKIILYIFKFAQQ